MEGFALARGHLEAARAHWKFGVVFFGDVADRAAGLVSGALGCWQGNSGDVMARVANHSPYPCL